MNAVIPHVARNSANDVTIAKALSKARFTDQTAIQFKRARPRAYAAAVKALAEPRDIFPYRWIISRYRVTYGTLRAVEIAEVESLQTQKKNMGDLMLSISEQAAQKTAELIPDIKSASQAAMVMGVSIDKFMLFRDQATQRIAVDHNVDNIHDKLREVLQRTEAVIEGEWEKIPERPAITDKAA